MTGRIRRVSTNTLLRHLFFWLMLIGSGSALANAFPINANPKTSNDGTVRLTWSAPADAPVRIQRGNTPEFSAPVSIYRGTDSASVITGLTNGQYFFRGRVQLPDGQSSNWGDPVAVTVKHHSLARALSFFAIGAVVFISTLLLILFGARNPENKV